MTQSSQFVGKHSVQLWLLPHLCNFILCRPCSPPLDCVLRLPCINHHQHKWNKIKCLEQTNIQRICIDKRDIMCDEAETSLLFTCCPTCVSEISLWVKRTCLLFPPLLSEPAVLITMNGPLTNTLAQIFATRFSQKLLTAVYKCWLKK